MANEEVKIYQLTDNQGNKVAPKVPERAVVDETGITLDNKLKGLGLDAIKEAQDAAIEAVNQSADNFNKNTGISEYETFSDQKAYYAGDTVRYNGLLYTFKVDHAIGVWDETQVEKSSLKKDIDKKIGSEYYFNGTITKPDSHGYTLVDVYIPQGAKYCIKYKTSSDLAINTVYFIDGSGTPIVLNTLPNKEGVLFYVNDKTGAIANIGFGYLDNQYNTIPFDIEVNIALENSLLYSDYVLLQNMKDVNEKLNRELDITAIRSYYAQKSNKNFINSLYNNTLCDYLFNDFNKKCAIIEIPIENVSNVWIEFNIDIVRMFSIAGITKSLTLRCNIYTNGTILKYSFSNKNGETNVIDNALRIGLYSNKIVLVLGTEETEWGFVFLQVNDLNVLYANGDYTLFANEWLSEFTNDLSEYSDLQNVAIEKYDSNLLIDYTTKNELNENIESLREEIGTLNTNAKSLYVSSMKDVYLASIGHIKELINSDKNTPINLLFIGDSITNFQNGWETDADKTLPLVSNERPLCMYNTYTFTNYIWKMLNPNAVDRAYRDLIYGGSMGFIKATHDTKVTKSGTFISSYDYSTGVYNGFGSNGGYPGNGIKEFLYTKNVGDYIEFKVPANIKGFSVIANCYQGSKGSTSSDMATATTQMQVSYNGSVIGTENLAIPNGTNKRFDYVINSPIASDSTIKIVNNEDGKYMGVWGIEYWTDKCVRPINNGLAGNSVNSFINGYDDWVKGVNPDVIVFEACILNDTRLEYDTAYNYYETLFSKFKEDGYKVILLITHAVSKEHKEISININDCPDINDPEQTPRYYIQYQNLVIELCKKYDIPYINVCQYQIDKYNGDIPTDLFAGDNIHLSYKGHDMYKELLGYVLKNCY